MKFPDITTTPPTLSNGQYSLGGVTFGSGQSWSVQKVTGLDLPKTRSQDTPRPLDSGEFAGLDFLSGRDVTITFHAQESSDTALRTALNALEAVFMPPEDGVTETPMWFQRPGNPLFCCQVRARQFRLDSEMKLSYIHLAQPVGLVHATSAYVYGPTQSASATVGGQAAGVGFPWTFDLSFGGGGSIGVISISNSGAVKARPVYVFSGPVLNPVVTLGGQMFGLTMQLFSGDQLVVDTDLDGPSCVYYPAGASSGYSVTSKLMPGSVPLYLPVGANKLVFTSSDPSPTTGSCEVVWAPTFPIGI